jgi:type I restriction enzyme S subunit
MGKYQAYPEYKDPSIEWLDVIPAHWDYAPLKHVVQTRITDGPHETPEFHDEGIPFLSAEAVKSNSLDFSKKRGCITPDLHAIYSRKCLPRRGDIFMVKSGNTTGALAMVETDVNFNIWSPLALVRTNSELMFNRFLFYVMCSDFFQRSVQLSWSQGTQPNIGMGVIENLITSCPSTTEQKLIASFLDHETAKIDRLIARHERLIELLKEKRQAVISHAVTKGLNPDASMKDSGVEWLGEVPVHWGVKSIKRLTLVKRGASPRPIDDQKYFDDDGHYAWVRIADSTASAGCLKETTQRLSALGASLSVPLQPGEMFLSIAGTVGLPCITEIPACIHDGFVYFPDFKENKKFLFYIFQAGECYKGLGKFGTQLNLNSDTVGFIKIGVPSRTEQEEIVAYIDERLGKLDVLIAKAQEGVSLLNEHRTALISAAVTGKIDVRGWQKPDTETQETATAVSA